MEISRRCTTLLTTIVKEFEDVHPTGSAKNGAGKGKREATAQDDEENERSDTDVHEVPPGELA